MEETAVMRPGYVRKTAIVKRVLTGITAFTMMFVSTFGSFTVSANEYGNMQNDTTVQNDIHVEGNNSFGTMLAADISAKQAEQEENNGYNIFSVEVTGNTALVEFEAAKDSTLVVGIYDESGSQLIASGYADVIAGETEAYVDIETEIMPQYFYAKAYLIDRETMRPLCAAFDCPMYTRDMQEFLAMTTADFNADKVLNMDESTDNNFAVFSDDTIVIKPQPGVNSVISADDNSNTYVIGNADETVRSLRPGDVFSYRYSDTDIIIAKVSSVSVSGDTVTVIGADSELEDVFSYVKIDASAGMNEADIDPSTLPEGATYEGMVDVAAGGAAAYALNGESSLKKGIKISFEAVKLGGDDANITLSGEFGLAAKGTVKYYLDVFHMKDAYVELKLDYSAEFGIHLTGSGSAEAPLAKIRLDVLPGVAVTFTPKIIFEMEVDVSVTGTLKGTVGVRVSTADGIESLCTKPKFESEFKGEIKFFLGIAFEPALNLISEKLVNLKMSAKVGAEVKGTMVFASSETDPNVHHICGGACVDGEVYRKFSIGASAKLFNSKKFEYKLNAFEKKDKLFDFYYSVAYSEFGLGDCPHNLYKTEISVYDDKNNKKTDAAVTVDGMELTSDTNTFSTFLSKGTHTVKAECPSFTAETVTVEVKETNLPNKVMITMLPDTSGGEITTPSEKVTQVSLGGRHSAAITQDGSLYMWGDNSYGQLGSGTTTDSYTPIKIMDNAASVSLGEYHSAAITNDGSLYMWGDNNRGQLGNGTTTGSSVPIKVMDNVADIELGYYHSAAITNDGSLYIWGYNNKGQLGNGTTSDSHTPIKIMDNVSSVCLGDEYSAAITTDKSLYLWGDNQFGQLGNNTYSNSTAPVKIMDNAVQISIGYRHCGAIKQDGSLYMWGYNTYGELGNNTTDNSALPIKIMNNILSVSVSTFAHSAAITNDHKLYLWGNNDDGQLGNNSTVNSLIPMKIMDNITSVCLGDNSSGVITDDGSLYMWGYNQYGQLGNGTTTDSSTPIKITIPPDSSGSGITTPTKGVKLVSLGSNHSAAITANGDLYTWGSNHWGQLGNGTYEDSSIPIKIISNVASVDLGVFHSAAISTNGDLYTWGSNVNGELGNGTTEGSNTPIKIMDNVATVSLAYKNSAAITTNGDLYIWGDNWYGQLGNGTTENSGTPIKIMSNVVSVNLGVSYNTAITTNGDLYAWGDNSNGEFGNGTTENSSTPVKIMSNVASVSLSDGHRAAITTNGDLYIWGNNWHGQLGNGTTEDSNTPIKIMGNVASVSLSYCHSAVITTNGDLYTWGGNFEGQLGNGTTEGSSTPIKIMSNVISVCLGAEYSAAITTDGDLYIWGRNYEGQLGNGETSSIPRTSPEKITLPTTSTRSVATVSASTAMSNPSATRAITGLVPNRIYNIYGMKSDTAEKPFSADNLLYIYQTVTDASGTLVFDYLPDEEYADPKIFVREIIGDTVIQPTYIKGDVNGDGKITAIDLVLTKRYVNQMITEISPAADMNGDGKVTTVDYVLLKRAYAKLV